jgi:type VI secretion system (T6SS) effector TldE1-like protein
VLGCGWAVYANIFAASPYPQLGSASVEAHVASPQVSVAVRIEPAFASLAEIEAKRAISASAPAQATASVEPSLSFDDRFAAASAQGVAPAPVPETRFAEAAKPQAETTRLSEASKQPDTTRQGEAARAKGAARVRLAAVSPAPEQETSSAEPQPKTAVSVVQEMAQRAKAAVMSIASNERHTIVEKLWGKQPSHGPLLAYASADASVTGSVVSSQNPALGGSPPYDLSTAVYDISAHTVYLPDGTRLEAHSGLGPKLDDPSSANIRMRGVTPPHIYELKPREALFHGVAALRLNPIGGEDTIYGRAGLLAHTYMLGPNGDSNGCVSFKDYNAFLNAYRNQGIRKLAVVARVE